VLLAAVALGAELVFAAGFGVVLGLVCAAIADPTKRSVPAKKLVNVVFISIPFRSAIQSPSLSSTWALINQGLRDNLSLFTTLGSPRSR
jgi:hypothetical protein